MLVFDISQGLYVFCFLRITLTANFNIQLYLVMLFFKQYFLGVHNSIFFESRHSTGNSGAYLVII